MEPGHEDREYLRGSLTQPVIRLPQWSPVMKTGNTGVKAYVKSMYVSLNGARS